MHDPTCGAANRPMTDDEFTLCEAAETIRALRRENGDLQVRAMAFNAIHVAMFHTRIPPEGAAPDPAWALDRMRDRIAKQVDAGSKIAPEQET